MSTRQISFIIHGMYCGRCSAQVERALTALDGVIAANVNYAAERATVICDPRRWNPATVVAVVTELGFSTPLNQNGFAWTDLPHAVHLPADAVVQLAMDWHTRALNVQTLEHVRGDRELGWRGLIRALWRAARSRRQAVHPFDLAEFAGRGADSKSPPAQYGHMELRPVDTTEIRG